MKFLGVDLDVSVLKIRNALGTFVTTFASSATANRTITLPDNNGTLALLSDIPAGIGSTVVQETPTGTVNGSNTVFTLSAEAVNSKVIVMLNGLVQNVTDHYTISGTTLTFTTAPFSGSTVRVFYLSSASVSTLSQFENIFCKDSNNQGTSAKLVMSIKLPAGVYKLRGMIGADIVTDTATLEARLTAGTVQNTITRTGGLLEVTSSTSFTLTADTYLYLYLYGSGANTISYISQFGFVRQ